MKITVEASAKMRNMSWLCALLVVAIHVPWSGSSSAVSWLLRNVVSTGIAAAAVPYFFLASGFFLARRMDGPGWYGREVMKRVKSLLIPYWVWLLFAIIITLPVPMIADYLHHRPLFATTAFSSQNFLRAFGLDLRFGPSSLTALWYVRSLFILVLLSPVLSWMVRKAGVIWLIFCFILTIAHRSNPCLDCAWWRILDLGFSLTGLLYFSCGVYLQNATLRPIGKWLSRGLCAAAVLLILLGGIQKSSICKCGIDLTTVAIPFVLYGLWTLVPTSPLWRLAGMSFPLYLLHLPALYYLRLFVMWLKVDGLLASGILYCGAVGLSLCVAYVLKWKFPRMAEIVFGGRV